MMLDLRVRFSEYLSLSELDMGPFLLTKSNLIHTCMVLFRTRKISATNYFDADF